MVFLKLIIKSFSRFCKKVKLFSRLPKKVNHSHNPASAGSLDIFPWKIKEVLPSCEAQRPR
jgi:hypothetical protein